MPVFDITAPDGTKYKVTAPPGASEADALARVKAQHETDLAGASQRPSQVLGPGAEDPSQATSTFGSQGPVARVMNLPEEIFNRGFQGVLKSGAGVAQLGLDVFAPSLSNKFTSFVNELEKESPKPSTAGTVAEVLGEAAPAMSLGPVGGGVVAGGTAFQPSGSPEDRMVARAVGEGAGAGFGTVGSLISKGIGKVLSSRALEKYVGQVQKDYGDLDPAITPQRGKLNELVGRLHSRFNDLGQSALAEGDKLGPINMADVEGKLRDLSNSTGRMLNPDKKAVRILDNAADVLAPERKLPPKLVVGGRDFFLDPTGQYVTKDSINAIPPRVVKQLLDARGVQPAPKITYSQMKQSIEEMDNFLKGKDSSNPAIKAVSEARNLLTDKLERFTTPSVKALEKQATTFYNKNLAQYDTPGIKGILETTDPLERANKALNVALGRNPKEAQAVAGLIGPKGQEAVRQGMIKKALDSAFNKKSGYIDPVKFASFFEDKPGFAPFRDAPTDNIVKGVTSLLKEDALAHGESRELSLSHPTGMFGGWIALDRLFHGDLKEAAIAGTAAVAVRPTFKLINNLVNDVFGRNLLVAASKAPPGSPRMARIMQTALTRFAGPASGVEGGRIAGEP